jgi:hypothetical protein
MKIPLISSMSHNTQPFGHWDTIITGSRFYTGVT